MDSSAWQEYAKIDPELEALLPHLPPPEFPSFADHPSVASLRAQVQKGIEQGLAAGIFKPADFTGIRKIDIQIPVRDGTSIRAVHYAPENGEQGPLFVYYHGGGYTFGFAEAWEAGFELLTKELGFVIVSVDYRLAPEKLFPTAANDSWDALQWVAKNASSLGADPAKGFIVGGTSAGGNMAAVAVHEAVDANLSPPLTGQFLSVPNLLNRHAVPSKYKSHYNSMEQNKNAMILDQRGMDWFVEQYKADLQSPVLSPLNWPTGHKKQPPTYLQVCGMDPLRDEGLIYEYVLREECGIPTKLDVYKGLPHGALDFLPMLSASKQGLRDARDGIEWLLKHNSL